MILYWPLQLPLEKKGSNELIKADVSRTNYEHLGSISREALFTAARKGLRGSRRVG
jgi:hypothetical protein